MYMKSNIQPVVPEQGQKQQNMLLALVILFSTSLISIEDASAVAAIFTGLNTFAQAVVTLLGAAVIVGLVSLLIVNLSQGQVNWGPILFALLAVVFIAGIAANVQGFLGALGINVQAAGASYGELNQLIR